MTSTFADTTIAIEQSMRVGLPALAIGFWAFAALTLGLWHRRAQRDHHLRPNTPLARSLES